MLQKTQNEQHLSDTASMEGPPRMAFGNPPLRPTACHQISELERKALKIWWSEAPLLRLSPSVFYWCQISWVWKKDLMNFSNFSPTSSGDVLKGWIKSIIIIIVIIKIKIIKRNYTYNHHHQNPTSNLYMLKGWTISTSGKPSIAEIFPLPKSPENGHFAETKKSRNISSGWKYSQQKWSMICVN